MFDLAISIVTYNSDLSTLNRLVEQINNEKNLKIKLIIIDNMSDNSYFLKLIDLKCSVISAGKNLGYGASHNLANYLLDNSKYYVVLNPDIYLENNTLLNCFNFMEKNYEFSLISPLLKNSTDKYFRIESRTFSFLEIIKRRFGRDDTLINFVEHNVKNKIIDTNFISGAFMFFRREHFKLINGFDERFFMYLEDVDICKRIVRLGRIGILDNTFAFHERTRASYKSIKMMFIHLISFLKFNFKNYKN